MHECFIDLNPLILPEMKHQDFNLLPANHDEMLLVFAARRIILINHYRRTASFIITSSSTITADMESSVQP